MKSQKFSSGSTYSKGGEISIQWITKLVSLILISWIVIYPVDSII